MLSHEQIECLVLRMNLAQLTMAEVFHLLETEGVLAKGHFALSGCHSGV